MAEEEKTTTKRRKNLLTGVEGKKFTPEAQPTPEAKSEGWKKLRAKRLLTQAILAHMTKEKNLESYINSLYANAKKGNPKAIETINKGIEDDIAKVAFTDTDGNDVKPFQFILDERYKTDTGSNNSSIPA